MGLHGGPGCERSWLQGTCDWDEGLTCCLLMDATWTASTLESSNSTHWDLPSASLSRLCLVHCSLQQHLRVFSHLRNAFLGETSGSLRASSLSPVTCGIMKGTAAAATGVYGAPTAGQAQVRPCIPPFPPRQSPLSQTRKLRLRQGTRLGQHSFRPPPGGASVGTRAGGSRAVRLCVETWHWGSVGRRDPREASVSPLF